MTRVAIDVDLDQPVVLAVQVSVHRCRSCGREFRAQPSFLRPDGIYTRRVVQKAVEAVYCDGLAARHVPDRLARDFWVRPSEKMVRLWCKAFADRLDFAVDYQPWVVASFSRAPGTASRIWFKRVSPEITLWSTPHFAPTRPRSVLSPRARL